MKGWKEEEIRNKALIAPCGLHCGACGVYIATRDNNDKFKAVLGKMYGTPPEKTVCLGCMQPEPFECIYDYCKVCSMRSCVKEKGFYSCHQCEDWPCRLVKEFVFATGRQVMERAIPLWREQVAIHGDEEGTVAWSRAELERYHCPTCGQPLFRGAQVCRACKEPVADQLDGTVS